ncbi:MAG: biotin--[acetyl-CoA-carboxylase] ligase [Candidatus Contendobacter sp.]|nr:biotin--[acetyl-CoA-carboxylase] ligase [Candidatus Contendobacter sp.]
MSSALELLDRECILAGLTATAQSVLSRLELFPTLDSTNAYLQAGARDHWPSGAVCLAEQQSAGRGRLGRSWLTPFGASLALSLLWRFNLPPEKLSGLSLATGIAVARTLQAFGVSNVGLKWPNDVWWRKRKLGGILLDSGSDAGVFHVVAGIGLNVNLPSRTGELIDQPWVDLQEILATPVISRNRLAANLINELIETFIGFKQGGFADLAGEWARFDVITGQRVQLQMLNRTITGIARGVNITGALLLETESGEIKPYIGGEISLRVQS